MQKPSKKSWQDEGANLQGGTEPEPLLAEVDAESDDDEIQIINKKPKQELKPVEDKTYLATAEQEDPPQDYIPLEKEPPLVQSDHNEAKSDADWLRSRTSRLLDLVDEDEAPVRPMSIPSTQATTAAITMPSAAAKENDETVTIEAETEADVEMETPTVNVDEEAIRLSRRLFLRNLSYSITEDELRAGFAQFGDLEEVRTAHFHTSSFSCDEHW